MCSVRLPNRPMRICSRFTPGRAQVAMYWSRSRSSSRLGVYLVPGKPIALNAQDRGRFATRSRRSTGCAALSAKNEKAGRLCKSASIVVVVGSVSSWLLRNATTIFLRERVCLFYCFDRENEKEFSRFSRRRTASTNRTVSYVTQVSTFDPLSVTVKKRWGKV